MARRKLAAEIKPQKHFKASSVSSNMGMGTRKMALLAPFVISGGKNTERFYFQHISRNIKELRVIPEYFGKESSYTSFFPEKINKILKDNNEAKIFCVFDWDTIYGNKTNLEKHNRFVKQIRSFIDDDRVILCPSMPCFEYWFLLHFKNTTNFVGTCEEIAKMFEVFGFANKIGNSSIFAGKVIEVMKKNGRGTLGHIAIGVNNVPRAEAYLKSLGYSFIEESRVVDDKGTVKAIYLDKEFGGFAVHLVLNK